MPVQRFISKSNAVFNKTLFNVKTGCGLLGAKYDPLRHWEVRGKTYLAEREGGGSLERSTRIQEHINLFLKELNELDFEDILEVGCGYGKVLKSVQDEFLKPTVGVDFSRSMLKNAIQYLCGRPIPLVLGDAKALPFADESFDIVYTRGALQHVQPGEIEKAISECARIAKKYIIHMEDKINTPTNYPHDYKQMYARLNLPVVQEYLMFADENFWFILVHKGSQKARA